MRQQILDFVDAHGKVTLADLHFNIDGFQGDKAFTTPDLAEDNIWLWQGISDPAIDAVTGLIDDGEVAMMVVAPKAYYNSGLIPGAEVAYKKKYYEKHAWLPICLISSMSFDVGKKENGEENWAENEAEYCLDYLEKFIHENRNVEGVLPDGSWAEASWDLQNIVESHGEMLSKVTLARKDFVFAWIGSKGKPKLLADEIQEQEKMKDLMDAFAEMSGEQLRKYYQAMAEDMDVDDEQ